MFQTYFMGLNFKCIVFVMLIRPRKKNVEFPLTRPTLFYGPDPTDFIGKFVYTELKGQYKTVKPLTGDCKNAGHWTILMKPYEKGWKSTFKPMFTCNNI